MIHGGFFLVLKIKDIDECSASDGVCDVNADCENTLGSYVCSCKDGFSGNGKTCSGRLAVSFNHSIPSHVMLTISNPAILIASHETKRYKIHVIDVMNIRKT